ncbi:NAD(P)/FAD-dependent oxidoreductase [Chloroflexota bacterium]
MSGKTYDVVVVGCGPGGAVAGKYAALNGARTLIVEKKRQVGYPEHDFCAICYSLSDIERMVNLKIDPGCIIAKAEEIVYFSPEGRRGKGLRLADSYWVNRSLLERSLATEAIQAGAEIMVNATVSELVKEKGRVKGVVVRSGHETMAIECPVVIGASGPYANIPIMAGLPPPKPDGVGMAYDFVGVKSLQPGPLCYEIYTGAYGGGLWAMGGMVSQHSQDKLMVGLAWALGVGKKKGRVSEVLNEFKNRLQEIGKYNFDEASPVSMRTGIGAGGAIEERHHKIITDGVMLVGDASGKPLVASQYGTPGIFNAMFTGRIAGEAAAVAIREGDVSERKLFREYVDRVDETSRAERPRVMEARDCTMQVASLSADKLEKAVKEIGEELVALRLYSRCALALSGCLKTIQDWLRKEAS